MKKVKIVEQFVARLFFLGEMSMQLKKELSALLEKQT